MVHSGYHPLKHRPLRVVFGWCTVDIILLNIVSYEVWIVFGCVWMRTVDIILLNIVLLGSTVFGVCLDGAQWISSS